MYIKRMCLIYGKFLEYCDSKLWDWVDYEPHKVCILLGIIMILAIITYMLSEVDSYQRNKLRFRYNSFIGKDGCNYYEY